MPARWLNWLPGPVHPNASLRCGRGGRSGPCESPDGSVAPSTCRSQTSVCTRRAGDAPMSRSGPRVRPAATRRTSVRLRRPAPVPRVARRSDSVLTAPLGLRPSKGSSRKVGVLEPTPGLSEPEPYFGAVPARGKPRGVAPGFDGEPPPSHVGFGRHVVVGQSVEAARLAGWCHVGARRCASVQRCAPMCILPVAQRIDSLSSCPELRPGAQLGTGCRGYTTDRPRQRSVRCFGTGRRDSPLSCRPHGVLAVPTGGWSFGPTRRADGSTPPGNCRPR